ncbi:hypothetical protein [Actinoplanes auranticolor]|nr:hypothetical protein [Actinoplanes auranticolor]
MTKKWLLAGFGALALAMGGCGGPPTPPDRAVTPEIAVTERPGPAGAVMGDSPPPAPRRDRTPPVVATTVTVPPLPARPARPVSAADGVAAGPPARDTAPGAHQPPRDPEPVDVTRPQPDTGGDDGSAGDDPDEDLTGGEDADGGIGPGAGDGLDRGRRSGCNRVTGHFRDGHRARGHWRCR